MNGLIRIFGAATDVLGVTLGGVGAAILAWKYFNAPWWVLLFLSLAGLAGGMWRFYLLAKKWESS